MTHFTPLNGRVAGISGVFGDFVLGRAEARGPKGAFVLGLLVGAVKNQNMVADSPINAPPASAEILLGLAVPASFGASPRSVFTLGIAGLFVGVGTRLGNGCTSGHGVCGISRFSLRSIVATMTFMLVAGLTVFLVDHVWRVS